MSEDTVTITISRADADYMAEDEWVDDRLERIAEACRVALQDKDFDDDGLC